MAKIRICSTFVEPKPWAIPSDDGPQIYSTTPDTLGSDGFCTCLGYNFTGKCKHISRVNLARCRWVAKTEEEYELEICPACGEKTLEYESDPEIL